MAGRFFVALVHGAGNGYGVESLGQKFDNVGGFAFQHNVCGKDVVGQTLPQGFDFLLGLVGGFGGGFGNGFGGAEMYPWMNQADITTNGFQNLTTQNQISAIGNGIDSLQMAMINGFNSVEQGANNRQMANMQTSFNLQSQLSQCCCDNRLATVQTQNIVQAEGAATRLAIQNQTQQILDKLCQQEIDAKNDKILELQNQLNIATFNASQVAQTAQIISSLPTTAVARA